MYLLSVFLTSSQLAICMMDLPISSLQAPQQPQKKAFWKTYTVKSEPTSSPVFICSRRHSFASGYRIKAPQVVSILDMFSIIYMTKLDIRGTFLSILYNPRTRCDVSAMKNAVPAPRDRLFIALRPSRSTRDYSTRSSFRLPSFCILQHSASTLSKIREFFGSYLSG